MGFPSSAPIAHGNVVVQSLGESCPPSVEQTLVVRDIATREVLWTGVGPPSNFGTVSVAGEWIVTGNGAFPLAGCGAPTCTRAWQPANAGVSEPYVFDGAGPYVFAVEPGVGQPTGAVRALSLADGQVAWTGPFQGNQARAALDDDHVYVAPSSEQGLVVFDRHGCGGPSCPPAWSVPVPGGATFVAVAGDVVYAAGGDDRVHAFPAEECTPLHCPELASVPVPGIDTIEGLAVAEGRLLVTSLVSADLGGLHRVSAYELPD